MKSKRKPVDMYSAFDQMEAKSTSQTSPQHTFDKKEFQGNLPADTYLNIVE